MRTNTTQWSKTERFVLSATFGFLILSLFAPCGVRASQVIEPSAARIRETLPSELFRALENIERDSSGAVEVQLAGRNGVGVIAQLAVPAVVTPTPAAIAQWAVGHYNGYFGGVQSSELSQPITTGTLDGVTHVFELSPAQSLSFPEYNACTLDSAHPIFVP